jgi:Cof subfamily protein (haloacid dehalogenase superfamily)
LATDIRLIALDLDGTLLNPQNQVSDQDAAAVREAVAAGVSVVFATSRWHQAARRTAVALGLDGYIISHNGALVRSCDGSRELRHFTIDEGLALALARHIDAVEGDAYMTIEDHTYLRSSRIRDLNRLPTDMALCNSLEGSLNGQPTAFLLFGRDAVRATVEAFRHHHDVELNLAEGFSETFPDYLNIVHARADKGAGLLAVCDALDVAPEAAMAVGDAGPDVAMFRAAGIGVAMGNAAASVKAAATALAPPNSQGGVAWAIRKFVLG